MQCVKHINDLDLKIFFATPKSKMTIAFTEENKVGVTLTGFRVSFFNEPDRLSSAQFVSDVILRDNIFLDRVKIFSGQIID